LNQEKLVWKEEHLTMMQDKYDPTTVVQKPNTSDKEMDTARKASPGSTTATEKDEDNGEGTV
jgi:hypothetical protein